MKKGEKNILQGRQTKRLLEDDVCGEKERVAEKDEALLEKYPSFCFLFLGRCKTLGFWCSVDDILVYSESSKEHKQHFKII